MDHLFGCVECWVLTLSFLSLSFSRPRGEESKARRAVRTNNFTQQTNALDVDKHM